MCMHAYVCAYVRACVCVCVRVFSFKNELVCDLYDD